MRHNPSLKDAGVTQKNDQLTSFDRLFPNQNKLSGLGFGNLIAYPFQGKAIEKDNTLFLNPEPNFENSFLDQLEVMRNILTISESDLDQLIGERDLRQEKVSSKTIELSPISNAKMIMDCITNHYTCVWQLLNEPLKDGKFGIKM